MDDSVDVGVVDGTVDEIGAVTIGADNNVATAVEGTRPGKGKGVGFSSGVGGGEERF